MSDTFRKVKAFFSGPKMPKPEAPVPLPMQDSMATLQAGRREAAASSARSGDASTRLSEQRLGDQGSPYMRTGALSGSSVITA